MASLSHDGRSFTVNGRRRWLVGATIDLGRHTRDRWPALLDTVRHAGFNAVGVRLCWAMHEQRPGKFDFTRDLDAAALIRLIAERRMLALLRPGPFVGAGYDAGGLPGWLVDGAPEIVRTGDPAYKAAASRWLLALMREVAPLQLTAPGAGGPIVLIENEHAWFKGHDALAAASLNETARFLREAGARVPIINANNLFAAAEGELDAWICDGDPFTTLRQLRAVRPDAPPILLDLPLAHQPAFGEKPDPVNPDDAARTIALALAAGGQLFVDGLLAGLTPGFFAGRDQRHADRFFTAASCPAAPISYGGQQTPLLAAVRRITTFATSFERVLATLDSADPPITVDPGAVARGVSVVHARGEQGGVAFVFPAPGARVVGPVVLSLPDGQTITIDPAGQPVVPLLFDATLGRGAELDWCSLAAFANVGQTFVCFGPPRAAAALSINGTPIETTVPRGQAPLILEHESVTIAILSHAQTDHAFATDDAFYLGCDRLDAAGEPVPAAGAGPCMRLGADGSVEKITRPAPKPRRRRTALTGWTVAPDTALDESSTQGWTPIDAPKPNAQLGDSLGPRWLRARFNSAKPVRGDLGLFTLRDRGLVFFDGESLGAVGDWPDTDRRTVPISIPAGEHCLTILTDHLGRPSGGAMVGEPVGLVDAPWLVAGFRLNKPKLETTAPLAPAAEFPARVWDLHEDEPADPRRITWRFTYRRTAPLYLRTSPLPAPALVLLNAAPIAWVTPGERLSMRLPVVPLRRGANALQLAVMGDAQAMLPAAADALALTEAKTTLPGSPVWSTAPCVPPHADRFAPVTRDRMTALAGSPVWLRARFRRAPDHPPVALDPRGLSKGHALVNGRSLGRFIVSKLAQRGAAPIPIPIPPAWLNPAGPNEMTLFDEFGATPGACRLTPL